MPPRLRAVRWALSEAVTLPPVGSRIASAAVAKSPPSLEGPLS